MSIISLIMSNVDKKSTVIYSFSNSAGFLCVFTKIK